MSTTMTPAQAAQQNNREACGSGRYAAKQHGEADFSLPMADIRELRPRFGKVEVGDRDSVGFDTNAVSPVWHTTDAIDLGAGWDAWSTRYAWAEAERDGLTLHPDTYHEAVTAGGPALSGITFTVFTGTRHQMVAGDGEVALTDDDWEGRVSGFTDLAAATSFAGGIHSNAPSDIFDAAKAIQATRVGEELGHWPNRQVGFTGGDRDDATKALMAWADEQGIEVRLMGDTSALADRIVERFEEDQDSEDPGRDRFAEALEGRFFG